MDMFLSYYSFNVFKNDRKDSILDWITMQNGYFVYLSKVKVILVCQLTCLDSALMVTNDPCQ